MTDQHTVGGTVTGLAAGNRVVLRLNGGNNLPVTDNGAFSFSNTVDDGSTYNVTVFNQPTTPSQTCQVSNGSGTVSGADVTNANVSCTTDSFTVGGTVSGLAPGNTVALRNNGGDQISVNNGAFTFPTALLDQSAYAVTVQIQPTTPSQTCTVSGGSGNLAGADVTNVSVTCVTDQFTVGGTVSGLAGSGLVLRLNGGNNLPIAADGSFTFGTALDDESTYAVTVFAQPTGPSQTCSVSGGSGTLNAANVTTVSVTCTTNSFTVGGSVSGLAAGNSVVLRNNGGDNETVSSNGSFTFSTALLDQSAYAVTVFTQPTTPNQQCTVSNGSGNLNGADITNVGVT